MWFCNVFVATGTAVKDANNLKLEVIFSSTRVDLTLWSQLKSKQIQGALLNLKRHCSLMVRSIRGYVGIDLDNDDRCTDTNTNLEKQHVTQPGLRTRMRSHQADLERKLKSWDGFRPNEDISCVCVSQQINSTLLVSGYHRLSKTLQWPRHGGERHSLKEDFIFLAFKRPFKTSDVQMKVILILLELVLALVTFLLMMKLNRASCTPPRATGFCCELKNNQKCLKMTWTLEFSFSQLGETNIGHDKMEYICSFAKVCINHYSENALTANRKGILIH